MTPAQVLSGRQLAKVHLKIGRGSWNVCGGSHQVSCEVRGDVEVWAVTG